MATMLTPSWGGALRGGVQPAPWAPDGGPAPLQRVRTAAGAALHVLGRRPALHAGVAGRPGGHDPRLSPPVHQIMLVVNGIHLRAVTGDVRRRASEDRGTVAKTIRPVTTMRGPMKGRRPQSRSTG